MQRSEHDTNCTRQSYQGVQEVKNFIPGLEDLHFLIQDLPKDALVKRLQELQETFFGGEKKNDQKLCFVAKRETGEGGEEDGR